MQTIAGPMSAGARIADMVAGVLLPLFLAAFGFVRNVEQTAESMLGITLAFSVVPFLFAVLKAAAIWVYPLTQVKVDQIENDLRDRRILAG